MDGLIDRARKRREMKADPSKGGGDGEERTMGADNNEETGEEKDEKGGRETREEARRGEEDERKGINRCSVEWWMRMRPLSTQRALQHRITTHRRDKNLSLPKLTKTTITRRRLLKTKGRSVIQFSVNIHDPKRVIPFHFFYT